MAGISDQNRVFPLCREFVVFGDDGPAVGQGFEVAFAGVDHGFDGEDHAGDDGFAGAGFAVVENLGVFVDVLADAVAAEFADDGEAVFLGVCLDGGADVAEEDAGFDHFNA